MTLASSDEERLRSQIQEFVGRREYDAALRLAVDEADHDYGRQQYAQGIDLLNALIQILKDRQVALWSIYIGAYQKIVGLDNQLKDKSATIRDLVELSRYCIKDGDFDKALAASSSAIGIDTRSTDALNQKARVLAYRRDYVQAFKVLGQSLEVSPQNPRTLYLKASILGNNGRFADALAVYEQLRMADPSYPGLGKAIAEMRGQIDWKVKAVEGPAGGMRASQSPEVDRVPAIERKSKAIEPDEGARNTLETLYDEAVVADELPAPQERVPADQKAEGGSSHPDLPRDLVPETSGDMKMETIPVPHQAWVKPGEESPTAARCFVPSEAAGLTVLSPEELRLASLRKGEEVATHLTQANAADTEVVSRAAVTAPPSPTPGQEAERQLIGIVRGINQGKMEREDLMQRLSDAGSVAIPLSLGVLYLNFLRNPQDAETMSDLLTWLERGGYTRLPLFVVEEALAQGARVDFHDPQIASIVLSADGADMAGELRTHKAELLLERGDTTSYVREELGMVRQAAESASAEGIVHQLVHVLERCLVEDACTQEVLAAAAELGVVDQLVDRVTEDANMVKVPALEAAIVERLGRTGVDESTFLNNDGLFQHVTLSVEKSAILRRVLANAINPTVRRKVLQSLLVLGTPNMAEFTELVGLMARERDTSNAAYLIQYLVDHRQEVTEGRFLLEKLAHLVPADFESRYGLGLAAEQLGVHDAAAGYFVAAIRAHPGDPDTVQRALEAILASGEYDLIADAISLSQLSPADVEGLVDKAAAGTSGITAGSVEQRLISAWAAFAGSRYEEAVAMSSGTVRGGGDLRFYLPMALSFVHLGLPELATRELDHAMHLPNVTDEAKLILKYHAAVIHLAQGSSQQAAQLFQEVGESSPGFRDTEELLSKCGSQGSKIMKL
ncbi:tetratricopeptide repeat protein [Candidatus Cryosericum hinesii]|uniref:Tetratricopeptide repeat protein n=2 Tax=Candidatus Cryosericum TaxID=2498709 RepID=A0A398DFW8_9BACT|nr:tetratricopeptide repeat protein [Candidatus Cryosericum odellii]RIE09857.1 tetratricopeptide repeat protein [Candidatus Cryosericum hinesii]RIE12559.1 tetratricopeptide repeat protein [Candidatus Cryosericum hinesii]RIE12599.1 tetratricopeptide repeat protein [Candidatus Cryosericum hinesii]